MSADLQAQLDLAEARLATAVQVLLRYADETIYDESRRDQVNTIMDDRGAMARAVIEELSDPDTLPLRVAKIESSLELLMEDFGDLARVLRKEQAKEVNWDLLGGGPPAEGGVI